MMINKSEYEETSLAVQWLGLYASIARGVGLIPGWGTKTPHAMWCSQKMKTRKLTKNYIKIINMMIIHTREIVLFTTISLPFLSP